MRAPGAAAPLGLGGAPGGSRNAGQATSSGLAAQPDQMAQYALEAIETFNKMPPQTGILTADTTPGISAETARMLGAKNAAQGRAASTAGKEESWGEGVARGGGALRVASPEIRDPDSSRAATDASVRGGDAPISSTGAQGGNKNAGLPGNGLVAQAGAPDASAETARMLPKQNKALPTWNQFVNAANAAVEAPFKAAWGAAEVATSAVVSSAAIFGANATAAAAKPFLGEPAAIEAGNKVGYGILGIYPGPQSQTGQDIQNGLAKTLDVLKVPPWPYIPGAGTAAVMRSTQTALQMQKATGMAKIGAEGRIGAPKGVAASNAAKGGTGGPGAFMNVSESMSPQAAAYQARAAGTNVGSAYVVNGVKFDGYANGMLIDAKAGYAQFVKNGQFQPWFNGADGLAAQAQRQISAANGAPIQWRFAEEAAANATRNLFQQRGITGIDIVHFP